MTKNKPNYTKKNKVKGGKPQTRSFESSGSKSGENTNYRSNVHVSGDINDPSYYFSDPVLMEQVTRISFNDFLGISDTIGGSTGSVTYGIPYFMRINLNPSPGFTSTVNDGGLGNALNLASLELYTKLSANNGRTASYAPQDIATLLLAIGDIISMSAYITRIFGTAYLYNRRNRAYPREIIRAQGVDYDDLMANFANYRAQFNGILTAQSEIPFPANLSYFTKCAELYSGLYVDEPNTDMASVYAFVPSSVWILDDSSDEEGTMLGSVDLWSSESIVPMSDLLTIFNQMLSAVNTSASITNNIYSDILRLAKEGTLSFYQFAIVPDEYRVFPMYVPEVVSWVNNMRIMGKPVSEPGEGYTIRNNVYHDVDTNKIVYRPQFKWNGSDVYGLNPTLNFTTQDVTAPMIVSATRLVSHAECSVLEQDDSIIVTTEVCALPDHYVTDVYIYTPLTIMHIERPALSNWELNILCALTNFDFAPILYLYDGGTGDFSGIFGDVQFYTQVDFDYLSRLHDTAYLGLFEIR